MALARPSDVALCKAKAPNISMNCSMNMMVRLGASSVQTWAGLRAKGIRTPEVAAWQRLPVAGQRYSTKNRARASYPYVMNVYNAPAYSQASCCHLRGQPGVEWQCALTQQQSCRILHDRPQMCHGVHSSAAHVRREGLRHAGHHEGQHHPKEDVLCAGGRQLGPSMGGRHPVQW